MFKDRIIDIRILLKDKNIDALFIIDKSDIFYLTGLNLEGFWLVITKDNTYIIASEMLVGQINDMALDINLIKSSNFLKSLSNLCYKEKIKHLGISFKKISHFLFKKLSKNLDILDIGDLIDNYRMVKSTEEIDLIKTSCKIAKDTIEIVSKMLRPGLSESFISFKIEEIYAKKYVKPAFSPIVASGINTSYPHHISSFRKLQNDEIIIIDSGCNYNGYCSDLTRTFFLGKMKKLQFFIYKLVKKAHDETILKARNGIRDSSLDSVARNIIKRAGYGKEFIHSTGHGVGIDVHEQPRINSQSKNILKSGMVITIEPGIYIPGQFGVRIEDTVLIKDNGCEVLT